MRCLHCNKKLSLLKMAKGDSFCSPEHFDAYQLELSRSAYDRLVSLPDEDVPKQPLVLKKSLEGSGQDRDLEADLALSRLAVLRAPEKKEAAPALQVPPYAPFLASPVPYNPPDPVVPASELDGSEPVVAVRELAFPVHDLQATVFILNLYLRLSLAETPPLNWEGEIAVVNPENFLGEIARPELALEPNVELFEDPAPAGIDEAAPAAEEHPIEALPSIEPAASTMDLQPVSEPVPPEGMNVEPFENPAPDEAVKAVTSLEPEPPIENQPVWEPEAPMPAAALDAIALENPAPDEAVEAVTSLPAAALDAIALENVVVSETDEPVTPAAAPPEAEAAASTKSVEKPLPFLVAPSFRGRDWAESSLDKRASAASTDWVPAPALNTVQKSGEVWTSAIARSTSFAGIPPVLPRDAAGQPVQSSSAMTAAIAPLFPRRKGIEFSGWQMSSGQLGIGRQPLETVLVSTSAVDFALPAPAPVRPVAALPAGHPGLIPETGSLARSILKTRPQGQEAAPGMLPGDPMECGFMAILAPFPEWKSSSTALRNQAPHLCRRPALADSAAPVEFAAEPQRHMLACSEDIAVVAPDGHAPSVAMLPCHPAGWRGTDFALPRGAGPAPTGWQPPLNLVAASGVWERPELAGNVVWRSVFERRFIAAVDGVSGHLEAAVPGRTSLPLAADIPVRDWEIGLCAAKVEWNPCLPATPTRPLAFLPARDGAILPSARTWPRLDSLAQ